MTNVFFKLKTMYITNLGGDFSSSDEMRKSLFSRSSYKNNNICIIIFFII